MTPEPTSEAWAQIRYDYEHTERPVGDICAEHGISPGTLRDRMRRWGWPRRRPPIPFEGPPPFAPSLDGTAPALAASPPTEPAAPWPAGAASPIIGGGTAAPADERPIAERLQGAIARVFPAIECTLATLGSGPARPRELECAARALAALTRTLRELKGLLAQHPADRPACDCERSHTPEEIDAFRIELTRRINAMVDQRTGQSAAGAPPLTPAASP